jgi:hypothetical protein
MLRVGHVHVVPPKVSVVLTRGAFRLRAAVERPAIPMPLDEFFTSLAADERDRAIGIVLAGANTDGSAGRRGAHKVSKHMTRERIMVARCTVERLMKQQGLRGVIRGSRVRTTTPELRLRARWTEPIISSGPSGRTTGQDRDRAVGRQLRRTG